MALAATDPSAKNFAKAQLTLYAILVGFLVLCFFVGVAVQQSNQPQGQTGYFYDIFGRM